MRNAIVGAIAGVMAIAFLRAPMTERFDKSIDNEDIYYLPSPGHLRFVSLGHREFLTDLLWCKALIYFGEQMIANQPMRHIFKYAESMAGVDPYFKRVYRWLPTMHFYRPGEKSREDGLKAVEFVRKGHDLFPDDGKIAWELAAALAYEMPAYAKDKEEIEKFRGEATRYLAIAARMGEGPSWLVLGNATHFEKLGKSEQAARHLEEMYLQVGDPDVRAEIGRRLAKYRSEAYAAAIQRTLEEFQSQHLKNYPYMPSSLFLLAGERIMSRTDYLKQEFGILGGGEEQDDVDYEAELAALDIKLRERRKAEALQAEKEEAETLEAETLEAETLEAEKLEVASETDSADGETEADEQSRTKADSAESDDKPASETSEQTWRVPKPAKTRVRIQD